MLKDCTRSKNKQRVLTRHVWQDSKVREKPNGRNRSVKYLYRLRYQTVERSFADAKELRGLRYCRLRGQNKVLEQALILSSARTSRRLSITWTSRLDRQSSFICFLMDQYIEKRQSL